MMMTMATPTEYRLDVYPSKTIYLMNNTVSLFLLKFKFASCHFYSLYQIKCEINPALVDKNFVCFVITHKHKQWDLLCHNLNMEKDLHITPETYLCTLRFYC